MTISAISSAMVSKPFLTTSSVIGFTSCCIWVLHLAGGPDFDDDVPELVELRPRLRRDDDGALVVLDDERPFVPVAGEIRSADDRRLDHAEAGAVGGPPAPAGPAPAPPRLSPP